MVAYDWEVEFANDPNIKLLDDCCDHLEEMFSQAHKLYVEKRKKEALQKVKTSITTPTLHSYQEVRSQLIPNNKSSNTFQEDNIDIECMNGDLPTDIYIDEYLTESSIDNEIAEVDPMDELSDFETDESISPDTSLLLVEQAKKYLDLEKKSSSEYYMVRKRKRRRNITVLGNNFANIEITSSIPYVQSVQPLFTEGELVSRTYPDTCNDVPHSTGKNYLQSNSELITLVEAPAIIERSVSLQTIIQMDLSHPSLSRERNHSFTSTILNFFQQDLSIVNQALEHTCSCEQSRCELINFPICDYLKRFLRTYSYVSYRQDIQSSVLFEKFNFALAYHSVHCALDECSVPMCNELRNEGIL